VAKEGQPKQPALVPTLALPTGGGAIRGIGETFQVSAVSGTAGLSIPLPLPPGRAGFAPQLALSYDSGAGNGPFGLGWQLSLSAITRKTEKGLPTYNDADEADVFLLAGSEDLVPALRADGTRDSCPDSLDGQPYLVQRYRPRVEGAFARIERWTRTDDGDTHWRVLSRDNQLTIFGRSPSHRIADPPGSPGAPPTPQRVFSWLIEEARDRRGNIIRYEYRPENLDNVTPTLAFEQQRLPYPNRLPQRYLDRVLYGNDRPDSADTWHFQVVFDYSDHTDDRPEPRVPWPCRPDPFSTCRPGFELRTYRRCQRVLAFHQFPELGAQPVLVRSLRLNYHDSPAFSLLTRAMAVGHQPGSLPRELPPLELTYHEPILDEQVRTLEAASLEHLPVGIDGGRFQWVDLDGEGIAGVLSEQADAWWYARNRGAGRLGPVELVATQPSPSNLSGGGQHLADLGGDGRTCLVQYSDPLPGYFERTDDGGWAPFRPFPQRPNISWDDPNLRFADVTGDGHADVLIAEDERFVVFPSRARDGFGPPIIVPKPSDDTQGPALVFADAEQTIFLADMNGDGLSDIVRIRNGEVCYWPSLGYGRFGPKVTMAGVPWFDHPDQFQARRIRLADIDGSGTTDIIYLGCANASFWINQAGNSWGETQVLRQFPAVDSLATAQALDLLGTGLACLVWSSSLPGEAGRQIQYIDLLGSRKPYLLRSIENNLGARTELEYTPSTRFYLEDRAAGTPWVTRLPFPVHLVERSITHDLINDSTFTTHYRYRHGFYDRAEREFRGFALVEQWDTAEYAPYRGAGQFDSLLDADLDQPPAHTKTWFHTGAYQEGPALEARLAEGYYDRANTALPPTVLPPGLSAVEAREAARALKGLPLRSELYADDVTEQAVNPYSVETHAYTLKLLQPLGGERHAVFFPHPREAISYHYERNPADPRVTHAFTLEVSSHGTVTRSAAVAYGRRDPAAHVEQRRQHITYTEVELTNLVDEADDYHAPLPWQTSSYELTGVARADRPIAWEAIETATRTATFLDYDGTPGEGLQKRLIERERQRFYRDELAGIVDVPAERLEGYALLFGRIGVRPLPYEGYKQAFTPGLLRRLFEDRVDDALLREGGYVALDGGWWVPTGRQLPDPTAFFQPVAALDPFGNRSTIRYDAYALLVREVRDPLDNTTRAEHDYRVLQPRLVTDPNSNQASAAFDTLGMVVATALLGKPGSLSGDELAGFAANLSDDELDRFLANPDDVAPGLLGRATTRIVYDVGRWGRLGQPVFAATISRVWHVSDPRAGEANAVQIGVAYSDGLGRALQTKAQAEAGDAPARGPDGRLLAGRTVRVERRWTGSGRVVYNNKGNPVKQYEPFFSDSAAYESEAQLVETGVTPVLRYDPLGRVVRTDMPDGTFTRVKFNPWEQETWDQNDTVRESRWYRERGSPDPTGSAPREPRARAAWLAAQHAGTPAVTHLDSLGRAFITVANNGPGRKYETRVVLDVEGNQREVFDARGVQVMWQDFDMLGRALHTISADAGERRAFTDIAGQPVRSWDGRGHTLSVRYDALRRPTHRYVSKVAVAPPDDDSYAARLVERIFYGESHPSPEASNLRGQMYQHYDGAGVLQHTRYDFKGNLVTAARRLAREYKQSVDWGVLAEVERPEPLGATARELVEVGQTYTFISNYDALNRPIWQRMPDNSTILPGYNRAGLLERVQVRLVQREQPGQPPVVNTTDFVTGIAYDAKGRRTHIDYGSRASTAYTYDPLSFRLIGIDTTRPRERNGTAVPLNNSGIIQALRYTYDPAGNIVEIRDEAQRTVVWNGERVEPVSSYVYDALYRLVQAKGREHAAQNDYQPGERTGELRNFPFQHGPGTNSLEALRNYTETYEYDEVGNFKTMDHHARGDEWVRHYQTAADSNRLLATSARIGGREVSQAYTYDTHGSMISMPHLPQLRWDHRDQTRLSVREVRTSAAPETTYYVYNAGGERARKVTESAERPDGTTRRLKERIYLGGFEIYREYDTDGSTPTLERTTLHVMDDQRRIALVETQTVAPSSLIPHPSSLIRYQHDNHLGSACLELDADANVITYEEYHPYGTSSFTAGRSAAEVSLKRYRYTGKERDDETGLSYHSARYYAPWLGRWTSADPAGMAGGANYYQYVSANPVRMIDPAGKQEIPPSHYNRLRELYRTGAVSGGESGGGHDPNLAPRPRERAIYVSPLLLGRPINTGGGWNVNDIVMHTIESMAMGILTQDVHPEITRPFRRGIPEFAAGTLTHRPTGGEMGYALLQHSALRASVQVNEAGERAQFWARQFVAVVNATQSVPSNLAFARLGSRAIPGIAPGFTGAALAEGALTERALGSSGLRIQSGIRAGAGLGGGGNNRLPGWPLTRLVSVYGRPLQNELREVDLAIRAAPPAVWGGNQRFQVGGSITIIGGESRIFVTVSEPRIYTALQNDQIPNIAIGTQGISLGPAPRMIQENGIWRLAPDSHVEWTAVEGAVMSGAQSGLVSVTGWACPVCRVTWQSGAISNWPHLRLVKQ
jgi:RHS repeat-associated protein